jgi:putative ABC transport system permease protein
MKTFFKIAWRNIIRNKRRSLITISAVSFGLGLLIFVWSFVEGAHKQMINNYTSLLAGHIQIHQKGFYQKQKLELNIPDVNLLNSELQKNSSIKSFSSRIKAVGLIGSSESSAGAFILGIDPDKEKTVSQFYKRIKKGNFLETGKDNEILISTSLAKNFNVDLGDKIIIMSQAIDGSIASGAYRIKGMFETGAEEIDKGIVFITLRAAQELFVMPDAVSEIVIQVSSPEHAKTVSKKLIKELPPSLEVMSWQEVSPSFYQWIEFDVGFIWIIVIIVMIVVAIGILNTVLMGVLERTREFGILLAVGTKPKQITAMVALESFFLGIIGTALGVLLGGLLTLYFSKAGINLTVFSAALNSFYTDPVIYPQWNIMHANISSGLVLMTSLLASIYPAWHASTLQPIDAIRSI